MEYCTSLLTRMTLAHLFLSNNLKINSNIPKQFPLEFPLISSDIDKFQAAFLFLPTIFGSFAFSFVVSQKGRVESISEKTRDGFVRYEADGWRKVEGNVR